MLHGRSSEVAKVVKLLHRLNVLLCLYHWFFCGLLVVMGLGKGEEVSGAVLL